MCALCRRFDFTPLAILFACSLTPVGVDFLLRLFFRFFFRELFCVFIPPSFFFFFARPSDPSTYLYERVFSPPFPRSFLEHCDRPVGCNYSLLASILFDPLWFTPRRDADSGCVWSVALAGRIYLRLVFVFLCLFLITYSSVFLFMAGFVQGFLCVFLPFFPFCLCFEYDHKRRIPIIQSTIFRVTASFASFWILHYERLERDPAPVCESLLFLFPIDWFSAFFFFFFIAFWPPIGIGKISLWRLLFYGLVNAGTFTRTSFFPRVVSQPHYITTRTHPVCFIFSECEGLFLFFPSFFLRFPPFTFFFFVFPFFSFRWGFFVFWNTRGTFLEGTRHFHLFLFAGPIL